MSEFTPWFDGKKHKPVRKGVYQQRNAYGQIGYQKWDGRFWYGWRNTPSGAKNAIQTAYHACQNDDWRGLAKNPYA